MLYLAPEPRSPHGVDIAPNGDYITVSGKLDPHATVYGFDLIKKAIEAKNFEGKDRYGVPILKFDAVVAGKVELGAGPLHTQYDNQGYAYTSLYLESAVAKWTLGEPYHPADKAFKLVDKVSIHYNIGHLATAQGDTMDPQGKYLVAMNKWSIDRHTERRPAASAELPADRHLGREDGAARRHADRLRRAALRADGEGRHDQGARGLRAGHLAGHEPEEPERDRQREGRAHRPPSAASSRSG